MRIGAKEVIEQLHALPAFPAVVTRLLAVLKDEDASLNQVEGYLRADPAITARLLAAANQLVRHTGREPVGHLHTAVSFLGVNRVREIVLSTAVLDFVKSTHCTATFWERSLAVGAAAQELAPLLGADPDLALVAGLLHDVGSLWLHVCHPQNYLQVLIQQRVKDQDLVAIEAELLGMDHLQIGRLLAEQWGLPAEIGQTLSDYRTPEDATLTPLVATIHLASVICCGLDLPLHGSGEVVMVSPAAIGFMVSDWESRLPELLGRISARYAMNSVVLR